VDKVLEAVVFAGHLAVHRDVKVRVVSMEHRDLVVITSRGNAKETRLSGLLSANFRWIKDVHLTWLIQWYLKHLKDVFVLEPGHLHLTLVLVKYVVRVVV
jgi:hypothetical protein